MAARDTTRASASPSSVSHRARAQGGTSSFGGDHQLRKSGGGESQLRKSREIGGGPRRASGASSETGHSSSAGGSGAGSRVVGAGSGSFGPASRGGRPGFTGGASGSSGKLSGANSGRCGASENSAAVSSGCVGAAAAAAATDSGATGGNAAHARTAAAFTEIPVRSRIGSADDPGVDDLESVKPVTGVLEAATAGVAVATAPYQPSGVVSGRVRGDPPSCGTAGDDVTAGNATSRAASSSSAVLESRRKQSSKDLCDGLEAVRDRIRQLHSQYSTTAQMLDGIERESAAEPAGRGSSGLSPVVASHAGAGLRDGASASEREQAAVSGSRGTDLAERVSTSGGSAEARREPESDFVSAFAQRVAAVAAKMPNLPRGPGEASASPAAAAESPTGSAPGVASAPGLGAATTLMGAVGKSAVEERGEALVEKLESVLLKQGAKFVEGEDRGKLGEGTTPALSSADRVASLASDGDSHSVDAGGARVGASRSGGDEPAVAMESLLNFLDEVDRHAEEDAALLGIAGGSASSAASASGTTSMIGSSGADPKASSSAKKGKTATPRKIVADKLALLEIELADKRKIIAALRAALEGQKKHCGEVERQAKEVFRAATAQSESTFFTSFSLALLHGGTTRLSAAQHLTS